MRSNARDEAVDASSRAGGARAPSGGSRTAPARRAPRARRCRRSSREIRWISIGVGAAHAISVRPGRGRPAVADVGRRRPADGGGWHARAASSAITRTASKKASTRRSQARGRQRGGEVARGDGARERLADRGDRVRQRAPRWGPRTRDGSSARGRLAGALGGQAVAAREGGVRARAKSSESTRRLRARGPVARARAGRSVGGAARGAHQVDGDALGLPAPRRRGRARTAPPARRSRRRPSARSAPWLARAARGSGATRAARSQRASRGRARSRRRRRPRGAAPYGSREPVGRSPIAKRGRERVELVGDREQRAGRGWRAARRRRRRAGTARRSPARPASARPARRAYSRADVALELGELRHQRRRLVGLGQPRRLAGVRGVVPVDPRGLRSASTSATMRSVLSASEPARAWNVMRSSVARQRLEPAREVLLERERRRRRAARPARARCRRARSASRDGVGVHDRQEAREARAVRRGRAAGSAGATASPSRARGRAARGSARSNAPASTCGALDQVDDLVEHAAGSLQVAPSSLRGGVERGARCCSRRCPVGTTTAARRERLDVGVGPRAARTCGRDAAVPAHAAARRARRPPRPSSTSRAVQQRRACGSGRAKRSVSLPQRMFLGICRPSTSPSTSSCASVVEGGRARRRRRPRRSRRAAPARPGSRPWRRANPSPAFVQPSSLRATFSGGPRCSTRSAACAAGTSAASTAMRRGETYARDVAAEQALALQPAVARATAAASASATAAGVRRQLLAAELDQQARPRGLDRAASQRAARRRPARRRARGCARARCSRRAR